MLKNLKIGTRLGGLLVLLLALLAIVGTLAISALDDANDDLTQTYTEKLTPVRISASIQRQLAETRTQLLLGLQHNPQSELARLHDPPLSMHTETIARDLKAADEAWSALSNSSDSRREIPAEEKALLDEFGAAMRTYIGEGLKPALDKLSSGDYQQSNIEVLQKTNPKNRALDQAAGKLSDYYSTSADQLFRAADTQQKRTSQQTIAACLLAALFAVGFGYAITRSITRPINAAVGAATRLAEGE
jgi:hypothetical protein